jgi:predicted dehydrogenase
MASALQHRRQFLKAAAAMGVWSQCAAARSASPNEKLNIGVIGVGGRGSDNLAALAEENIAALCDVDERELHPVAARYPKAKTHRDSRKLIEQNDLDAVVIATPNHTHAVAAIRALRRGLHVYCEKPLAHTFDEAQRMVAAARQTRRVTQMGNQHHASAGYRRAVQILQSGVLGDVREIHAWTSRPLWPQGIARPTGEMKVPAELNWDLWLGPAPARPFNAAYVLRKWRGWWDFGGGALGDFVPHILDPVYEGLRLGAPTGISPESSRVNDETLPEWSIVRFEFPAREKLPATTLTWYDGGKQPSPEVTRVKRVASNGALVIGEHGRLFIPELGKMPIAMANDEKESLALPELMPPPERTHWGEWVHACKTGEATSSDFDYGAALCDIALLGNIALRVGEKLEWDAQSHRITNVAAANELLRRNYRDGWQLE